MSPQRQSPLIFLTCVLLPFLLPVSEMNKAALKAVLARSDWFAQLDSEFADDILELGRIRRLNDSLIYSAGDVADGMFALVSGQVRMTKVFRSCPPH